MRLFLALDLPPAAREALGRLQRALEPRCPGWRWVRPESIHLTLRFLGEVEPAADLEQRDAWRDAAAGTGEIRFELGGLGVFPAARRPRVLWVGVREESGRLAGLALAVERAARSAGHPEERRPFRAHLTLARAARGRRPGPPPADVGVPAIEVVARELVLFRSRLEPAGARYTALEGFPLAG